MSSFDKIMASMERILTKTPAVKRGHQATIDDTDEHAFGYGYKIAKKKEGIDFGRNECSNCFTVGKFYLDPHGGLRVCSSCGAVKDRAFVDDEVVGRGEDKDGEKGEDRRRTSVVDYANRDDFMRLTRELAAHVDAQQGGVT